MKKLLLLMLMFSIAVPTLASDVLDTDYNNEDELFDDIAGGEEEFEFIRYTPEFIQMSIREDMKVACKKGMCTLFSISDKGDEFKAEFNVGQGEQKGESGTVVVVPGDYTANNGGNGLNEYIGLTLSYTYKQCTQDIRVPRSLYIAMNTYMYGLITEEGTTRRSFTPADEAMIVFYSTIIKQATGCRQ